jgi:glutathione synthase
MTCCHNTGRLLGLLHDSAAARSATAAAGLEVVLGVHRSDYMLDEPSGGFLQVPDDMLCNTALQD